MTTEQIIESVLAREGGYTDRSEDAGGPTNRGITAKTLGDWLGLAAPATVEQIKAISEEEARAIYRKRYVEDPGFDQIVNPDLRALIVDCGVLHGPEHAAQFLQRAVGVVPDGVVGPGTLLALAAVNARAVYLRVCGERRRFFGDLMARKPNQHVFALGWARREAEFLDQAAAWWT